MARERAHERTVATLGAQVGVDLPDHALRGVLAAQPHRRRGQPGGGLDGLLLVGAVGRLVHEHDVDVAEVVELAPAGLAHRDDRQPAGVGVLLVRAGDAEGGAEGGDGEVGQLGRRLLERRQGGEVARGDAQEHAAVGDAELVRGIGGLHHLASLGERQRRPRERVAREVVDDVRVLREERAERLTGAEHHEQPLTQLVVAFERLEQLRRPPRLGDGDE